MSQESGDNGGDDYHAEDHALSLRTPQSRYHRADEQQVCQHR